MAPSILHLPNGLTITVTPIFGGLYFKSNDLNTHNATSFPPGWTVVINTVDGGEIDSPVLATEAVHEGHAPHNKRIIHPYHTPTLRNDHLFISSISQPPSSEFRPASSQSRQIAMMLWATLYWYFQQPQPDPHMLTKQSSQTPKSGRPKADWRIQVNREGVFKSRVILPKLERMGLIASEDSCVGVDRDERAGEGWLDMFVSRRSFWQLDARIYLFTLSPTSGSPYPGGGTPVNSRPGSPHRLGEERDNTPAGMNSIAAQGTFSGTQSPTPFTSASHLPTYYPPSPGQYVYTNGLRHPLRPKPGRPGEIVYTRFVPSVGQYLTFRVASILNKSTQHKGPISTHAMLASGRASLSESVLTSIKDLHVEENDVDLLHKWMNNPRVNNYWGEAGNRDSQHAFLKRAMSSKHSVPLIGSFDGKPFGYFEIYWVKEDSLGRLLGDVGNYDRGIHCLVGEEEFRGPDRVKIWLSSLIHHLLLADNRTEMIMMEPRVDNTKLLNYALEAGFYKEKEVGFPHKQSNLLKLRRDAFEAPAI
ncbi:hypothetical protein BT63DRAFT_449490 [Microthyrium microscopicum]|uniref:Acyltransferase MbtK/IucB-like conserved domain-containing protein n=1 Tax=Microthyrium microscopicum TaxID=703497 RepID=A0A6A6UQC8_9PEZI|nr:hypothetical protein BT63DRAFT_449490 [Microthyrium microscopicum]